MRGTSGEAGGGGWGVRAGGAKSRGEVAASRLPPIHMRNNAEAISPSPPGGAEGVGRWSDMARASMSYCLCTALRRAKSYPHSFLIQKQREKKFKSCEKWPEVGMLNRSLAQLSLNMTRARTCMTFWNLFCTGVHKDTCASERTTPTQTNEWTPHNSLL